MSKNEPIIQQGLQVLETMTKIDAQTGFFRLRIHLWGLVTVAGVVMGAASLLGFLGPFHWLLDLF